MCDSWNNDPGCSFSFLSELDNSTNMREQPSMNAGLDVSGIVRRRKPPGEK